MYAYVPYPHLPSWSDVTKSNIDRKKEIHVNPRFNVSFAAAMIVVRTLHSVFPFW